MPPTAQRPPHLNCHPAAGGPPAVRWPPRSMLPCGESTASKCRWPLRAAACGAASRPRSTTSCWVSSLRHIACTISCWFGWRPQGAGPAGLCLAVATGWGSRASLVEQAAAAAAAAAAALAVLMLSTQRRLLCLIRADYQRLADAVKQLAAGTAAANDAPAAATAPC